MEAITPRIQAKLEKIAALAKAGIGGEKSSATTLLEQLCKKYGQDINTFLQDEQLYDFRFTCKSTLERRLLFQIIHHVLGNAHEREMYRKRGTRNSVHVWCNLSQYEYAVVNEMWAWHSSNWRREVAAMRDNLLEAYVQKHYLFGDDASAATAGDFDPEELEKTMALMRALGNQRFTKLIG